MRVLITGHRGYIGSVLTSALRRSGHDVVGLDCDLFQGCDFLCTSAAVPSLDCDVRDVDFADLAGFDAVVHLAALSDDASGQLNPRVTEEINYEATVHLAAQCKRAGVTRFLFASTCAVYGRGHVALLDEQCSTDPQSVYADSKLRCEYALASMADDNFTPVILRNATVYGVSPRLRLDLVVNDFVASAVVHGRINVKTAGQAWRPLIHVDDVAHAYAAVLAAPAPSVHKAIFNVVPQDANYQVTDIAEAVTEFLPEVSWGIACEIFDVRSYRVDGSKLRRVLPRLRFRHSLLDGIRQLHDSIVVSGLTPGDWRSNRYRRMPRLQSLMERGEFGPSLRRKQSVHVLV